MRGILVATAALAMSVSGALAGPLAPTGSDDGLEFGGVFQNPQPLVAGGNILIEEMTPNIDEARYMMGAGVLASAGAYELAGVEVAELAPFSLSVAVGAGNNGVSLNLNYDRSRVENRAFDQGANDQTGQLMATITSTLLAEITQIVTGPFTQTVLFMGGDLLFDDGAGVYDADMPGSWSLISVFSDNDDMVSVSLSLSTAEFQIPTSTPEPGIIALIGAGLLGAGFVTRRRG